MKLLEYGNKIYYHDDDGLRICTRRPHRPYKMCSNVWSLVWLRLLVNRLTFESVKWVIFTTIFHLLLQTSSANLYCIRDCSLMLTDIWTNLASCARVSSGDNLFKHALCRVCNQPFILTFNDTFLLGLITLDCAVTFGKTKSKSIGQLQQK